MESTKKKNKRSSERHETMGLMSTVSDGKDEVLGVVEDVSEAGFCLSKVPAAFDDTVEHCVTVIKGPIYDLTIRMRPCWARITHGGMYKVIGFQVDKQTTSWKSFIEHITSEKDSNHILLSR